MTALSPTPQTAQDDRSRRWRHQLLALGAGGLVLGIGAAVTMAAWTDTEHSNATSPRAGSASRRPPTAARSPTTPGRRGWTSASTPPVL